MSHCSRGFVLCKWNHLNYLSCFKAKNLCRLCAIPGTTISRFATAASESPKVVETPSDKNFAITEKAIKDAEELAHKYHKVLYFLLNCTCIACF